MLTTTCRARPPRPPAMSSVHLVRSEPSPLQALQPRSRLHAVSLSCLNNVIYQSRSVRGIGFDHLVRVSSLANPAISPIPLPSLLLNGSGTVSNLKRLQAPMEA